MAHFGPDRAVLGTGRRRSALSGALKDGAGGAILEAIVGGKKARAAAPCRGRGWAWRLMA